MIEIAVLALRTTLQAPRIASCSRAKVWLRRNGWTIAETAVGEGLERSAWTALDKGHSGEDYAVLAVFVVMWVILFRRMLSLRKNNTM